MEAIICFESVSKAIAAEQLLAKNTFSVKVMPTPSSVRAGCGICLRFLPEELRKAADFLFEQGFTDTEAYMREEAGGMASYEKISFANGGEDADGR